MWLTDIADMHPIHCNFRFGGIVRPIHGLVLHIQNSPRRSPFKWFNNPEARASSHFANPRHGRLEQFVDTDDMAWAQGTGNRHWLSVEHEGKVGDSLTMSQMMNDARLMLWLYQHEGVPLTLANHPWAFGLGYHSMGAPKWGHNYCPGDAIIRQRNLILDLARGMELSIEV